MMYVATCWPVLVVCPSTGVGSMLILNNPPTATAVNDSTLQLNNVQVVAAGGFNQVAPKTPSSTAGCISRALGRFHDAAYCVCNVVILLQEGS